MDNSGAAEREEQRRQRRLDGGRWLSRTRQAHGYATQTALAADLGIHSSRVSQYEKGNTEFSHEFAEQLAKLFKIDVLEVRRGLLMWVPSTDAENTDTPTSRAEEIAEDLVVRARRIEELARELVRDAEEEQRRRDAREDEDRRRGA